jgi:hypothetical protein
MLAHVTLRAATPAHRRSPTSTRRSMTMRTAMPTRGAERASSARVAYGNATTGALKARCARRATLGGGRRRFVTEAMFEVRAMRAWCGRRARIILMRGWARTRAWMRAR